MEPFFRDYLERLEAFHRQVKAALSGCSVEALDWIPGEEIPSLGVLAAHLAGAERYWIGDVAGQDSSGRDRDDEFRTRDVEVDELFTRLDASLDYARRFCAGLSLADLALERTTPSGERQITLGWALLHALEHTALHLGHIQIVRQLWDQYGQEA
jgi:uncharacterized damage-inducible protein DinB